MEFAAQRTVTQGLPVFPIAVHTGLSSPGPAVTIKGRKESQSGT